MSRGSKKSGRRPKSRPTRDVTVSVRLTPPERETIDAAAEQARIPVTVWARSRLLETADREQRRSHRKRPEIHAVFPVPGATSEVVELFNSFLESQGADFRVSLPKGKAKR